MAVVVIDQNRAAERVVPEDTASGWYVLDSHTRRAIGYLGASLAESGDLPADFEQPRLLDLWAEALEATMQVDELSPISDRLS
jgi:hypothetical protein